MTLAKQSVCLTVNAPQWKWPRCVWACRHLSSLQISWQKGSPPGPLPPWHLWVIKKICPLKGLNSSTGLLCGRSPIMRSSQNVLIWWRDSRLGTPSTSLSRSCGCSCFYYYYFHFTDEETGIQSGLAAPNVTKPVSESPRWNPVLPPQSVHAVKNANT